MQIGEVLANIIMSLFIELLTSGVSRTIDGVKNAEVKKSIDQEIQRYFDLHEDVMELQFDVFLSKSNILKEMINFLLEYKGTQGYVDNLKVWTEEYISFHGREKTNPYEQGIIRGAIDSIYGIIDRNLSKEYLSTSQQYMLHENKQSELRIKNDIREEFQKFNEKIDRHEANILQTTAVLRDDSIVEGEFNAEIKKICDNYQRNEKYKEAIEEYDKLLTKYALSKTERKNLVEEIVSNMAICYINLGMFDYAYERLKYCNSGSSHIPKYYYVTAYYYLNVGGIDNIKKAKEYAQHAIRSKSDYTEANLIHIIACSFLGENTENCLKSLDELFESIPVIHK